MPERCTVFERNARIVLAMQWRIGPAEERFDKGAAVVL